MVRTRLCSWETLTWSFENWVINIFCFLLPSSGAKKLELKEHFISTKSLFPLNSLSQSSSACLHNSVCIVSAHSSIYHYSHAAALLAPKMDAKRAMWVLVKHSFLYKELGSIWDVQSVCSLPVCSLPVWLRATECYVKMYIFII